MAGTMTSRRTFLAAGAASAITRTAFGQAAERKLKFGLIGCGWYGMVDTDAAFQVGNVECIALCDVDSEHLKSAADDIEKRQRSRPKLFKHYQELLDTPGLDFVIIGTQPHWHALTFIAACNKGLDVYCEKPVAYDIREGRAMVNAARKAGRVVQLGFQRREQNGFQEARKFLQSGQAGKVVQVDAQIHYKPGILDTRPQDPPASLDWDLWCGPAPKLPYSPQVGHKAWRLEKEYGNGHLVDWGIHLIDAVRVALNESMPKSVIAAGGLYELKGQITTPDILTVHFEFETAPVVWRHHLWGATEPFPQAANGVFFYCEKATVFATDDYWSILRPGKDATPEKIDVAAAKDAQMRHVANFLDAVRTRKTPDCPIEDAYQSTATVQLAMLSHYSGNNRVDWDARAEKITNNPAAAKMLKREYRAPYKHPYSG
jgi:predicted dehydrogenase